MKKLIRIGAALLTLCLLASMIVSCGSYDYKKKNLSKYIRIDSEDYTGIPVTLYDDYVVSDDDVEKAIRLFKIDNRTLRESKSKTTFIDYGDDAYIWYWGSYINETNGFEIQFEGGNSMATATSTKLTIGSGAFVPGFEEGLIDAVAQKTRREFDTTKDRALKSDSIVYLNIEHYKYTDAEGKVTTGSYSALRVDLANPGILGERFAEKLATLKVGDTFDFGYESTATDTALTIDWDANGNGESLAIVGKVRALASKESTIEVTAEFPKDYDAEELRGKTATFHVVIQYVDDYDLPELTPELLKEKYEDFKTESTDTETVLAEFDTYLREVLAEELAEQKKEDAKSKIWDYLMENTEFTGKYPKKAVKANRAEIHDQLKAEFAYYNQLIQQQYGTSFSSLSEFVKLYYDLDEKTSLSDYLTQRAKEVTREELIVYSIIKAEGWDLTDEEFDEGMQKLVDEYAELYDMDEDDVLDYFGREAIYESVLYDKLMNKLYDLAVITIDTSADAE